MSRAPRFESSGSGGSVRGSLPHFIPNRVAALPPSRSPGAFPTRPAPETAAAPPICGMRPRPWNPGTRRSSLPLSNNRATTSTCMRPSPARRLISGSARPECLSKRHAIQCQSSTRRAVADGPAALAPFPVSGAAPRHAPDRGPHGQPDARSSTIVNRATRRPTLHRAQQPTHRCQGPRRSASTLSPPPRSDLRPMPACSQRPDPATPGERRRRATTFAARDCDSRWRFDGRGRFERSCHLAAHPPRAEPWGLHRSWRSRRLASTPSVPRTGAVRVMSGADRACAPGSQPGGRGGSIARRCASTRLRSGSTSPVPPPVPCASPASARADGSAPLWSALTGAVR